MSIRFLTLAYWLAQVAFWLSLVFWMLRKEGAWVAALFSSVACVVFWAIRRSLPSRGRSETQMRDTSERSDYRAGVDAGFAFLFAFESHWPGTTQHGR